MGVCQQKENKIMQSSRRFIQYSAKDSTNRERKVSIEVGDSVNLNPNLFSSQYVLDKSKIQLQSPNAILRKAVHKETQEKRLIKVISKELIIDPNERLATKKEVNLIKILDHPNIIRVIEYFEEEHLHYIVYEYFEGLKLLDLASMTEGIPLHETQILEIVKQIFQTLNYMHSKQIVYRGVCLETIFCDTDFHIKFLDFEHSIISTQALNHEVGPLLYQAPEMLKGAYNIEADIWAAGVLMYFLMSGIFPFQGQRQLQLKKEILRGVYSLETPEWAKISSGTKQVIRGVLTYKVLDRFTAKDALETPVFKRIRYNNRANMKAALDNMKKFQQTQALSDAIAIQIVNFTITDDERKRLQKIFNELDENNDGKLSIDEIHKVIKRGFINFFEAKPNTVDRGQVQKLLSTIDLNNSGYMDFSEFVLACQERTNVLSDQELSKLFSLLDKDKSGTLTLYEIRQLLGGHKINDDLWNKIDLIYKIDIIIFQIIKMIKQELQNLVQQRKQLEADLQNIQAEISQLDKINNKSLVDDEGFPRADLQWSELVQLRNLKRAFNEKNNDHKDLMKQIEQKLYQYHQEIQNDPNVINEMNNYKSKYVPQPKIENKLIQQVNKVKIEEEVDLLAHITEVTQGSPSSIAGLQLYDFIISFGDKNKNNTQSLEDLANYIRQNVDQDIPLKVLRKFTNQQSPDLKDDSYLITDLVLRPQKWAGQGILGCRFKLV
ncbi:hypothetical protein pb186bvf_005019 [Paramecium bursaria]